MGRLARRARPATAILGLGMRNADSDIVVMKFGGTSVAGAEEIKRAARRIVAAREAGNRVVAVLSARGKTTDELVAQALEISKRPVAREMDMLLSTGERISCALCAMAIHDMGHEAISLTGSQAGIVTDSLHTRAKIVDVRADRIRELLDRDRIVLVAGFQGVSTDSHDVTTLGRGGSDTTAVALAAALGAGVCEIYTDVAGVYSADPRIVPEARKLPVASYEEMLKMSASGRERYRVDPSGVGRPGRNAGTRSAGKCCSALAPTPGARDGDRAASPAPRTARTAATSTIAAAGHRSRGDAVPWARFTR